MYAFAKKNTSKTHNSLLQQDTPFFGIQAKRKKAASHDALEKEADAVADAVVSGKQGTIPEIHPAPSTLQQKNNEQEEELQMKGAGREPSADASWIKDQIRGDQSYGFKMPEAIRHNLESTLNYDFSQVSIHTDGKAAAYNKALNAQAFTYGNSIYFDQGNYDTQSKSGQHLLTHELTHVVQQGKRANGSKKIQKKNNDEEKSLAAENQYSRLTLEQQWAIDSFCKEAHGTLSQWGYLRQMHTDTAKDIDYDYYSDSVRSMGKRLQDLFFEFKKNFIDLKSYTTLPLAGSHEHYLGFHQNIHAQKEVYRQLNSGTFPQYLKELKSLHYESPVHNYIDLFKDQGSFKLKRSQHVYKLQTIVGVESGGGEVVTLGGGIKYFKIIYENANNGISWSLNTKVGFGKIGAGVGSPVELNVESSMGGDTYNSGIAKEYKYYPPSYFSSNLVTVVNAGVGNTEGKASGLISFGDVYFNTSGKTAKLGTSFIGEAGIDEGVGAAVGGEAYDKQGLPDEVKKTTLAKRKNKWIKTADAVIFFATEDARIGPDDLKAIQQLVDSVVRHQRYYPGDDFRIGFDGTSTELWSEPFATAAEYDVDYSDLKGDPDLRKKLSERLNLILARNRAHNTREIFHEELAKFKDNFKGYTILDDYEWKISSQIIGAEGNSNDKKHRFAYVSIYHQSNPDQSF